MAFEDIPFLQYLGNAVDILLVWYVIYKLIMVIRGTKAVQLLKGIVVIVLVFYVLRICTLHSEPIIPHFDLASEMCQPSQPAKKEQSG